MEKHEAFTLKAQGLASKLITQVLVIAPDGKSKNFPALIDTGATHTCVSAELANEMGLVPVQYTESLTAGGVVKDVPVYVVDLGIQGTQLLLAKWKVVRADLTAQKDIEMLLGMDLLMKGDFSLTHAGGKTVASFRVPSILMVDYVPAAIQNNRIIEEKERREAKKKRK